MLPRSLVEEVDRLLKERKLSQRKIAAQLGVSRGTVGAIASGRRKLFGKEREMEAMRPLVPLSPPKRCPSCGYHVFLPCLVCGTRAFRDRRQRLRQALANRDGDAIRPLLRQISVGTPGPPRRARVA